MTHSVAERMTTRLALQSLELQRLDAATRRKVLGHLEKLREDITVRIDRWNVGSSTPGVAEPAAIERSRRLLKEIDGLTQTSYKKMQATLASDLRSIAIAEHSVTLTTLNGAVQAQLFSPALSVVQLTTLADNGVVLGGPIKDWWDLQSKSTRNAFSSQIKLGVSQGETNAQLVRRIVGQPTGKTQIVEIRGKRRRIAVRSGGAMNTTMNKAKGLVRTSVQNVSNQVMKKVYEKNSDIIVGVQAVVTFDLRTSTICIARAGSSWSIDTGKSLPESQNQEPFPGYPPWHMLCRTVLAPITKSWAQLAKEAKPGSTRLKTLKNMTPTVKASMDGTIAADTSFGTFLKRIGDKKASKSLGPARFDLWKRKKITTAQLIDQSGRPLTVDQLTRIRKPSTTVSKRPPARKPR